MRIRVFFYVVDIVPTVELGGKISERVPVVGPCVDKLLVLLGRQFVDLLFIPEPGVVVGANRSVEESHEDWVGLYISPDMASFGDGDIVDGCGFDDDVRECEVSADIAVAWLHE